MTKHQPEPEGFQPIEYTPVELNEDVETPEWAPIEVTPYNQQAAPVADAEKPATGTKEK